MKKAHWTLFISMNNCYMKHSKNEYISFNRFKRNFEEAYAFCSSASPFLPSSAAVKKISKENLTHMKAKQPPRKHSTVNTNFFPNLPRPFELLYLFRFLHILLKLILIRLLYSPKVYFLGKSYTI